MNKKSGSIPHLVIIGEGFSGTVLTAELVRLAGFPCKISLVDKSTQPAKGIAYGTAEPQHILNVRACEMGAFFDKPDDFYCWLKEHESDWRSIDPSFARLEISPSGFYPRIIYGAYLEFIRNRTFEEAEGKNIRIDTYRDEAISMNVERDGRLSVRLASGKKLSSNAAVLALGTGVNTVIPVNFSQTDSARYIPDVWSPPENSLLTMTSTALLSQRTRVVIVGSGLTTVDASLTLFRTGFRGYIDCISRGGCLPEVHRTFMESPVPDFRIKTSSVKLLTLFKSISRQIEEAALEGYDWRQIIDSLRPLANSFWQRLDWVEREKFNRVLMSLWNYYRHRVPAECLVEIKKRMKKKRFSMIEGVVLSIERDEETQEALIVNYHSKDSLEVKRLKADYVLNCSGPERDVRKNPQPLIQNLIKNDLIRPNRLHMGIQASEEGAAIGKAEKQLFVIGSLLFGERLETTAAEELRSQCSRLAGRLLSVLK